jgi:hypothetical protein
MNTSTILNQILTLFIIMVTGIAARKAGIINEQVNKKLSEILLHITSPALIFSSFLFEFSTEKLANAAYVFGFGFIFFIFSILLSMLLFLKHDREVKPVMSAVAVFSNCGYMGFPLLEAVLGKEGVFYGSIYVVVFNIFLWTYGSVIYSGQRSLKTVKNAFISPSMIAVYLGALVFVFQVPLPLPIEKAAESVGSMTMPLAMLIIGAIIAQADVRKVFVGINVYYSTLVRLLVMPLAGLGLSKLLQLPDVASAVCVIALATPAAVATAVFAEKYDRDSLLASKCVTVSTALSLVTIPLIMLLL